MKRLLFSYTICFLAVICKSVVSVNSNHELGSTNKHDYINDFNLHGVLGQGGFGEVENIKYKLHFNDKKKLFNKEFLI